MFFQHNHNSIFYNVLFKQKHKQNFKEILAQRERNRTCSLHLFEKKKTEKAKDDESHSEPLFDKIRILHSRELQ